MTTTKKLFILRFALEEANEAVRKANAVEGTLTARRAALVRAFHQLRQHVASVLRDQEEECP